MNPHLVYQVAYAIAYGSLIIGLLLFLWGRSFLKTSNNRYGSRAGILGPIPHRTEQRNLLFGYICAFGGACILLTGTMMIFVVSYIAR